MTPPGPDQADRSNGGGQGDYDLPDHPACPFCEHEETELHSPFGGALSVASYWCRRCRTAFEWVKWGQGSGPK